MQPINTTNNKTRSSDDEEELLVPRRSAVLNLFLQEDLPMLAFLTRNDRLILAETCTSLCKAVETYSKRNFQAIVDQHQVDNDFMDRVTAQGNLETTRQRPLVLPYRYILSKAMSSYLYKLQDNTELIAARNREMRYVCPEFEIIGNRLLIIMPQYCLWQLWDLSTKRCIHSIPCAAKPIQYILEENTNRIIIALSNNHLESWDLDTGEHGHYISLGDIQWQTFISISSSSSSSSNKALLFDNDRGVKIIDTDSGNVLNDAQLPPWSLEYDHPSNLGVVSKARVFTCHDDKWFVFHAWGYDSDELLVDGIFVFNLQDFQLVSHQKHHKIQLETMLQSIDDPATFAAFSCREDGNDLDSLVDVYTVNKENGSLEPKDTFSIAPDFTEKMVVTASHFYLTLPSMQRIDATKTFEVYNIETGKLERRVACPYNFIRALTVWNGGKEIIVSGKNSGDPPEVAAYCLAEPEQQKQQH